MHSKRNNVEFMIYDNIDEVTEETFESLLDSYQTGFETSMTGSDFVFDCVHLLYYKSRAIIYRFSQLNKKQKSTVSPTNIKGTKCF